MIRGHDPRAIAIALLGACQLDTSGLGNPSNTLGSIESSGDGGTAASSSAEHGTSADAADSTVSGPDGSESPADTGAETGSGPGSGSAETANESTGVEDDGTSGAPDPCAVPAFFAVQIAADQALVVAPMMLDTLGNGTPYVVSEVASSGTATFTFDVPCADEYYFHGFVYDAEPGPLDLSFEDNGADSYGVGVAGISATWHYGCQTQEGLYSPSWQWQPIMSNAGCIIGDDLVVAALPAGTHTIEFLNLESGTNAADSPGTAAALGVLAVTNDPSYSP